MLETKGRFFYGWVIVAAAFIVFFIQQTVTQSFSIFIKPLTETFLWSRAETTLGFALLFIIFGVLALFTGRLVDRYGPRIVVVGGGLALGSGLFLTSQIHSLWQFYLSFSFFGGVALACLFVSIGATIPRWFVAKRGLALGICFSAGGLGGLIMSPLLQSFIIHYNWRTTYIILAIAAWLVIIPAALFFKRDPSELGLRPLGETEAKVLGVAESEQSWRAGSSPETMSQDYTVSAALRTSVLWIYMSAANLFWIGALLTQVNFVPNATDVGIPAMTAATALGVISASQVVGQLGMGALSDRIGTKPCLILITLLLLILVFSLIAIKQTWMFFLFASLFGFSFGGYVPLVPRVMAELFGTRSMGAFIGLHGFLTAPGAALGPVLGAYIFDWTGSYSLAFLISGLGATAAFLLFLLLLRLPQKAKYGQVKVVSAKFE